MTTVLFNNIPGNLRAPFFFAEINSGGSSFAGNPKQLLVGQMTSNGTLPAGVPYGPVQSEAEVIAKTGVGSMLHAMFNIARRNSPFQPVYILPLADPAGVAATGSISINGGVALGVTGAAVIRLMGRRVAVQVNAADAASVTAAAIVAAINAANLPVTAAVDGVTAYKVDLTARHVGADAGNFVVKIASDEPNVLKAANCTIVAMNGGTGIPDVAGALANLGDQEFDWVAGPYADTTSLNATRDFFSDAGTGRWSPMRQLYGHYTAAKFDTLANLCTLGAARNDQHASIMGSQISPTPTWEWAAALAATEVEHLGTAPELSRPLQTLPLLGILPPDDRSVWWDISDRQALYSSGIAGYKVAADGIVTIDRLITTYQKNAANVPDATFLDIETMAQMMFVSRYLRNAVSNAHGRQALADDNPFNVAEIATPKDIRNTIIHAYQDLVALGVVENVPAFVNALVVVRNASNPNRVDAYVPTDVVNQLRIFAANITAFLQFQTPGGQLSV